jgi:hypothetical protein
MINNSMRHKYWTTNKEECFGFKPGELVIYDYRSGGGFAGAPQVFYVGLASGIAPDQPPAPQEEWYLPGSEVEYRIGGHGFHGYHYRKEISRS